MGLKVALLIMMDHLFLFQFLFFINFTQQLAMLCMISRFAYTASCGMSCLIIQHSSFLSFSICSCLAILDICY